MKVINADALIKAIPETRVDIFENCRNCTLLDKDDVISIINNLPSAEKHGRWIVSPYTDYDDTYECSVCGELWTFINGTPKDNGCDYCPHCGSKMDEVEE